MTIFTGRQGYLGLAIESVAGTPEASPSVFLPFTEQNLEKKHEKLMDISSRASRIANRDSVAGRKWTEGDVSMYLDAINSGYLFKLALGNEVKTNVSSGIDNHQFFVTASGNNPKTATAWLYRGTGPTIQQTSKLTIDTLELEITNEDLATMTASFMGSESTSSSAPTLTTTSGTLLTWANGSLRFGDTVANARNSTPTKITNFTMSIANNLQMIYRSGSNSVDEILMGDCEVTGEYTLFFENDTHLDYYNNNSKNAMVLSLEGANIGTGIEKLEIAFDRIVLEDKSIETGQDTLFAITGTYRAINDTNGQIVVVNLQNGKTTLY